MNLIDLNDMMLNDVYIVSHSVRPVRGIGEQIK